MNSKNQEGVFNPFESEDDFDQSPHAETDEELEEGKKIAGVVSRRESLQRRIESSSDPVIVEKAQQQLTKMDRADRRKELVSNTFQWIREKIAGLFTKDDKNKTSVEYDKETLISLQRLFEKIVIKKNIQEEENFSTRYSSIDNPFTRLYLEKPSQEKEYALIAQFIETYQTLIRKSKEGNDIIQCGNRFYIVPKKKK